MDARDGLGKIFLAAPINPKDLAPMVKTKHTIRWDTISNSIQITEDLRIGSIVLKSSPAKHVDDEQVIDVLIQILKKSYKSLLNIDENFLQLQARIESVRIWNPEANIPNVSDEVIFENWEWIKPFIGKVRSADDFKKINIIDALWSNITYEKQHLINQAAPEKIKVPSGSLIPILYSPQGAIPILAVRLQEVFGLAETPKINNEKQAVVMHLLSPGYRPVQVTSDLNSKGDTPNMHGQMNHGAQKRCRKAELEDDKFW
jgi:ATP-dependent helicase HrpB